MKTDLIINASVIEDGLVEDVQKMISDNPTLFEGEKVVLMADAHKGANVPVGFTMTLAKGLVPVEYVGSDLYCGVSGLILKDYVPTKGQLIALSKIARDIIPVNRRLGPNDEFTDMATLGSGNHFAEVGTNGRDTLISVHSGSRNFGGQLYKRHLEIAKQHSKERAKQSREERIKSVPPQLRQYMIENFFKGDDKTPLLDTSLYPNYWHELEDAGTYASRNRHSLLVILFKALTGTSFLNSELEWELVESVHNYVDTSTRVPILRKGSISAPNGTKVIIPINMRDGIIVGKSAVTDNVNYSLPHGAGRVLSRTAAHKQLDLEQFKEDMKDVISPTVGSATLDESPRAYKSMETILSDIEPYLAYYDIFTPLFNYKGV